MIDLKHKVALFCLWLAHKLEPKWIEGMLNLKDTKSPQKQEQNPFLEPPPK